MIRTRIISMQVNKIVGDTFDSIIELFPKLIPDAKINSDGWWYFVGPYGKSKVKFNQDKSLGILIMSMLMKNLHGILQCVLFLMVIFLK